MDKPRKAVWFLLQGAAFLLAPLLVWLGAVATSNETMHYDEIIRRQINDTSIIYGPAYSMNNHAYRSAFARTVRPSTLIIGDSRISLARSWFFNDAASVYNACWGAITPAEVQAFLESQPAGSIKTVLFSISHFDFNPNYLLMSAPTHDEYSNPAYLKPQTFLGASKGLLDDWKALRLDSGKLLLSPKNRLGVSAKLNEAGILTDGSFFSAADNANHALQTANGAKGHLGGSLVMIESGTGRFIGGETVAPASLAYMEELLAYCRDNGILLIGFLPPYAPTINEALAQRRSDYGYHYALPGLLRPMFGEYGMEFYDYTDVTFLGCDDSYFIDGYHPGDPVWVRMMLDMMKQNSALANMCDAAFLHQLDENRAENYLLYTKLEDYQRLLPHYPAAP